MIAQQIEHVVVGMPKRQIFKYLQFSRRINFKMTTEQTNIGSQLHTYFS